MKIYIGGFSHAAERFRLSIIAAAVLIVGLALALLLAGGPRLNPTAPAIPAPGAVSAAPPVRDTWYAEAAPERGGLHEPQAVGAPTLTDLHERHPAPTIIDAISVVR